MPWIHHDHFASHAGPIVLGQSARRHWILEDEMVGTIALEPEERALLERIEFDVLVLKDHVAVWENADRLAP